MLKRITTFVALGLAASLACAQQAEDGDQARKDKILANLKLAFAQLQKLEVAMDEIKPSDFEGLDVGSFSVVAPNGQRQSQRFFVTRDDKQLYFIGDPIDVSKSAAEIEAEQAAAAVRETEAARVKHKQLEERTSGLPMRGNAEAKVTIVEFSDFQCPYCQRGASTIEQVLEKYGDDVKVVFMHFPLGFHPWAKPAAIAASCAADQSPEAFWSLHDKLFANQKQLTPDNVFHKSKEFLGDAGVDLAAWSRCAEDSGSDEHRAAKANVESQMSLGSQLGVQGTPGFFINGRFLNGAVPLEEFDSAISAAMSDGP